MSGHTPRREIRHKASLRLPNGLSVHVDPSSASFAPPGWRAVLEEMHLRLTALDRAYRLAQVKEKFGVLRVYLAGQGHDPTTRSALVGVIAEYEERSSQVCQQCGAPGQSTVDPRGAIATLCDRCENARA
jgi:hypothetical protein